MKRPGARASFAMLVVLTLASWSLPIWEAVQHQMVSLVSVVTAAMFTGMLIAWPFLMGTRVQKGHVVKAKMCLDCRGLRLPVEFAVNFCLLCGSNRAPVAAGY